MAEHGPSEAKTKMPAGFDPLPPMVRVFCEGCGTELEGDGYIAYFEASSAANDILDWDWKVIDGKVYCVECRPFVKEAESPDREGEDRGTA